MYKSLKEVFGKKKSHGEIFAPMNGTCVPMSQVKEPTFSHEILGRGVAIIPCEGKVTAPEDGEILMVFRDQTRSQHPNKRWCGTDHPYRAGNRQPSWRIFYCPCKGRRQGEKRRSPDRV